jgi:CRP/FNR family cyclic AMP-dependent transcriptional regulator
MERYSVMQVHPGQPIITLETEVRSPYGLDIIESCLTCKMREDYLFCNLSAPSTKALEAIKSTAAYPKGALLFVEGQNSRGVFVLCHGRAKLSTSSADGKTIILKIAEPGEILGLSATVSGKAYEVTAELMEPSQANFITRQDFLNFLRDHGDASLRVAEQLSQNYHSAYEEIRSLGLSHSASEKLAKLLLEWAHDGKGKDSKGKDGKGEVRLTVTLTHEEIAQLIGTSRETVTRALADLKRKQLVQVKGSTVVLRNKAALEKLAGS